MFRRKLDRLADDDLMRLVRERDDQAFEALYDRHSGPAYSLAFRIAGDPQTAEEVVQEAFVSVWRNAERYDPARGSLRTWVLGIVHKRAIDGLRRESVHARRRASDEGLEERQRARELTDAEAIRREESQAVRAALRTLPGEQLRVLELAYFGGFTQAEIAEMLDTPLGTVKSRMRLGLSSLGGKMETAS